MHEQFMLAALKQAWLGRGVCAPNPAVGAVAVRDGEIIAQAFHAGAGSPHAEQKLLEQCPEICSDVTIYVTLEPCNHWGRTPPCVDILIARKVKHVVYGFQDPNPIVANKQTPQQLQSHAIAVTFLPLPEVTAFYQSYAYWLRTKRPWVTVKMAQTLDGKIAGEEGQPIQLSNQACFNFTHEQRLHTDVILTTAKTVNQDDPALNVRWQETVLQTKTVAILDTQGCLNPNARLFKTAKHCILYRALPSQSCADHSTFVKVPHAMGGLNLEFVLKHLGEQGFHDVWVEAGATLFNALHQAKLVHRTYLYVVPRALGKNALDLYHFNIFTQPCEISWQVQHDNVIAKIDWSGTCLRD